METITQTNRTLLFAEINPERKNILTLIGDVRGKSSLDDDKMKEINEELLVSSFDEFLEKTRPVVYSYCCLLYTSPSPRDRSVPRMPSSA